MNQNSIWPDYVRLIGQPSTWRIKQTTLIERANQERLQELESEFLMNIFVKLGHTLKCKINMSLDLTNNSFLLDSFLKHKRKL